MEDSASCVAEQVPFVRECDPDPEIIICLDIVFYHVGKMVYIYDEIIEAGSLQFFHHMKEKGFPPIGTRALGMVSVNGLSRVPSPAANIRAFICYTFICPQQFYIKLL